VHFFLVLQRRKLQETDDAKRESKRRDLMRSLEEQARDTNVWAPKSKKKRKK